MRPNVVFKVQYCATLPYIFQRATSQLSVDSVSSQGSLPSPSLPGTPRVPSLPPSGSSSSLGIPTAAGKESSGNVVETTTSFIGRGDSLGMRC